MLLDISMNVFRADDIPGDIFESVGPEFVEVKLNEPTYVFPSWNSVSLIRIRNPYWIGNFLKK